MIGELDGPWMILESALHDLIRVQRDPDRVKAELSFLDRFQMGMGSNERPPYDIYGSVAVIPCVGVFSQRSYWWSWRFSGDRTQFAMTHAIQNVAIKSIVLDIDSPGGTVAGTRALADYIHQCRKYKKRIVAVANETCASAALWIASAAHEVVATPSSQIGSLGTLKARLDASKNNAQNGYEWHFFKSGSHKTYGYPDAPMSDGERAEQQQLVNTLNAQFIQGVARNRDVTPEEAQKSWGNAQVWIGQAAVDVGLADSVNTLDGIVAKLSGQPTVNVSEQGNPEDGQGTNAPSSAASLNAGGRSGTRPATGSRGPCRATTTSYRIHRTG